MSPIPQIRLSVGGVRAVFARLDRPHPLTQPLPIPGAVQAAARQVKGKNNGFEAKMIRETLTTTKEATFAILLPNPKKQDMPTPMGTGFFVSPDGWFVTAAHVITENNRSDGPVRNDIQHAWLMKEHRSIEDWGMRIYQTVSFEYIDPNTDFALLKVDFQANSNKDSLRGKDGFPYIEVSSRELEEGEQVYSFGYPLSSAIEHNLGDFVIGESYLSPRVTSAIISSKLEKTKPVWSPNDPMIYVLDKALNYGNSGGP